jgi:hypothetical protein
VVDGASVEVADDGASLLDVLRDQLGDPLAEGRLQPAGPVRVLHVLVDGQPASPA